ncbi:tryptophan 7-halogenase [Pseudomonas sp. F1_0610]|uniref:flavin-dependent monooxygenase QhpG n=1 Tax=Pseudomonas sp. F1_0610 TaxID=3114284 RepID=UPI0039C17478
MQHIVVLGAGPAGAVCALGLHKLGYLVTVVSSKRSFAALEGVSQRVLHAFQQAGLDLALATVNQSCARHVIWNGQESAQNHEFLLDRPVFDQAIIAQLKQAGIPVIEKSAVQVQAVSAGFSVQLKDGQALHADFLVEARGRQAPASGKGLRGPETISLLNRWQATQGEAKTAVTSLPDGWSWMAQLPDGRCYWQITLDVASANLPNKDQLLDYCNQRRKACILSQQFFAQSPRQGIDLHARSSTSTLSQIAVGDNWIRIGDAAMAVDPLSGNGAFQSLSSALQAPAVIHTLLSKPEHKKLAQSFHQSRIENLFMRFARLGRDFYAQEQQWQSNPFWQKRSTWPDNQPMHLVTRLEQLQIATRPVLQSNLIVAKEVVITPDQPLGIWHLEGIELAGFVQQIKRQGLAQALRNYEPQQQKILQHWFNTVINQA